MSISLYNRLIKNQHKIISSELAKIEKLNSLLVKKREVKLKEH